MDGGLASIAIHPWFAPVEKDGGFVVDGGEVCNLPIEPAIRLGATEIIALDLNDPTSWIGDIPELKQSSDRLIYSVLKRQRYMETGFAETKGVPVSCVELRSSPAARLWDFGANKDLIETGYGIAPRTISDWNKAGRA